MNLYILKIFISMNIYLICTPLLRGVFPLELCIMLATFTAVTSVQFTDKYHNNNKSTKCKIFIHKEWSNIEGSEHKINTDVH